MDRPRKPERRCICRIYLSAYRSLPAGMAAAVSGVAAAGLGIPLPAAVHAGHGGAGLCALRGELLYLAAARRALSAVGSGTGVGSCRRGVRCRPQDPDQHGRHHHRGAGTDGGQLLPVPRPSQTALAAPAGGLCRHGCSPLPAGVRRVLTACRHPGRRHCAGRMDAGSLLPLLWRDHRLYDEPHQSGDR